MKTLKLTTLLAFALIIGLSSCKKTNTAGVTMNFKGLEALGDDYDYEGWLIVDGKAVSAGIFDIDANGNPTENNFNIDDIDFDKATSYVLTIEPSPDPSPDPATVHVLAGDINSNIANLTVDHASAIGTDFTSSTGTYILATPTDGSPTTDENSGVWFIDNSTGTMQAGLNLPTLAAGWKYEGWAVINGTPISTGTFTSVTGNDDTAPFSGTTAGPPFPGEDFVLNAPSGQTFPTDLAGTKVVISVEPSPDNSPMPFALKPLVADVATTAVDRTAYTMTNNANNTNITGTITLEKK